MECCGLSSRLDGTSAPRMSPPEDSPPGPSSRSDAGAAEVGSRAGGVPAGSAVPLRLGASRALLPASRAPGCPRRPDFGQPNGQATLPKNACGAGEPAARCRRSVWGVAEASRRGGVGDGSFVAFAWHATARGRPYEALDGVRLLSRTAVSPYYLEDVCLHGSDGLVAGKLLGILWHFCQAGYKDRRKNRVQYVEMR